MGTDAGPFPERFQGYFEHLEMEMMVEAGMTPAQVLRAATVDAARAMRVEGVGALRRALGRLRRARSQSAPGHPQHAEHCRRVDRRQHRRAIA